MEHAVKENPTKTSHTKQGSFFGKSEQAPFFSPVFVQPKLTIGPVDDPYEREADAVAERVMRMSDTEILQTKRAPINIQRKCSACEEKVKLQLMEDEEELVQLKPENDFIIQRKCEHCEEEEKVQMKGDYSASAEMTPPPSVHHAINSSGKPLDAGTRSFMESRFGYGFGQVRI